MQSFEIDFNYQGQKYSGSVTKMDNPPKFLVRQVEPHNLPIPNPYIFTWDNTDNMLRFGTDPNNFDLAQEIARSIFEKCDMLGIPYNK